MRPRISAPSGRINLKFGVWPFWPILGGVCSMNFFKKKFVGGVAATFTPLAVAHRGVAAGSRLLDITLGGCPAHLFVEKKINFSAL